MLWRLLYETAARAEEILTLNVEDLDLEFRHARVTSSASAQLDPHGQGWTLHQLRHSALQHLAQAGHSARELQAKSRHQHLASLGRYVRLGEVTSARITAEHDPAAPRRKR
ncbi:hypothetical protein AB0392_02890 [Nonomuraea angiospora]|uniref:hypothetical protein n=1 Tax=Nonomuraea angiospora TaxID=46172 RepID=UPI00344EB8C0